jgi:hypothetical protein
LKEDDVSVASTRAETFRMSWHTARQNLVGEIQVTTFKAKGIKAAAGQV